MFDIKANPTVGFVDESGATRLAVVNGVSPEGNPDLAVIAQVANAPHDPARAAGTWHYIEEAAAPTPVAAPEPEPVSEPVSAPEPTPTDPKTSPRA